MTDYATAARTFRIEEVAAALHGSLQDGLNVCVECCDRHDPEAVALRWESQDGRSATRTFAELRDAAARFANLLADQGVRPGDVVAGMLPRTPDLLACILGTWRAGAIYQPLFTAFGPKAIELRLAMGKPRLLVTDAANRPKLDGIAALPPVATVAADGGGIPAGDIDFRQALAGGSPRFDPVRRRAGDLFLLMSTSGTTGAPKGVPVPLTALPSFAVYMRDAIDLRPTDRFWNIADPGWAYGLYYAVTGPLLLGQATTFYDGPFTVESTYRIIEKLGITNLAGAPTAFRLLIAAGPEAAAAVRGRLRVVSSAGEPLNPEVIRWFDAHLAAPIHDHYGQTEIGMLVCNHHGLTHPVRPGSAGVPMPGYRVAVLDAAAHDLPPGTPGILAVDVARSPLMWFTGYRDGPPAAPDGYYRTGDTVQWEDDGSISFVGRSDDVITSAGYRIGPFEVESALIEHPAVVEAAVIGKPDPERTEIVKAFVVLARDRQPGPELAAELQAHVRTRLSAHAYPREVAFVESLPKTPSGKLQRFVLRAEEVAAAKQAAEAGES
jgi:acetyl-CoA synthetase